MKNEKPQEVTDSSSLSSVSPLSPPVHGRPSCSPLSLPASKAWRTLTHIALTPFSKVMRSYIGILVPGLPPYPAPLLPQSSEKALKEYGIELELAPPPAVCHLARCLRFSEMLGNGAEGGRAQEARRRRPGDGRQ